MIDMDTSSEMDPLEKALQHIGNIIKPNQSPAELIGQYDKWSSYDETEIATGNKGPKLVADAVEKYLPLSYKDVSVLDVAAGTGLVGEQLKLHGFLNVDALDPSEGMLNAARQKDVYRNYIQEFFPCVKLTIDTSGYDVLVVCGGFAEGHMKCDSLREMVRCVKPGGLIVISIRADYLTNVAEYKDRLEPLMRQLETDREWKILEKTIVHNYYYIYDGVLFVMKVTK